MLRKEECASGMVQRSNYAAMKDVQTILSKEECAFGMEQSANYAAVKGVQTLLK